MRVVWSLLLELEEVAQAHLADVVGNVLIILQVGCLSRRIVFRFAGGLGGLVSVSLKVVEGIRKNTI